MQRSVGTKFFRQLFCGATALALLATGVAATAQETSHNKGSSHESSSDHGQSGEKGKGGKGRAPGESASGGWSMPTPRR